METISHTLDWQHPVRFLQVLNQIRLTHRGCKKKRGQKKVVDEGIGRLWIRRGKESKCRLQIVESRYSEEKEE